MQLPMSKFRTKFPYYFMVFYPEHGSPQLGNGWNSQNSYGNFLTLSNEKLCQFLSPYELRNSHLSLHTNVKDCLNNIVNFYENNMPKMIVFTSSDTQFNDVQELAVITSQEQLDVFYEQYYVKE